jgi:hypothetical protein
MRQARGYLPQEFGFPPKVTAQRLLDHAAVSKGIMERDVWRDMVDALLRRTNFQDVRGLSTHIIEDVEDRRTRMTVINRGGRCGRNGPAAGSGIQGRRSSRRNPQRGARWVRTYCHTRRGRSGESPETADIRPERRDRANDVGECGVLVDSGKRGVSSMRIRGVGNERLPSGPAPDHS